MAATFRARYQTLAQDRGTVLCVGLDPALPSQRGGKSIPQHFLDDVGGDTVLARLNFCFDIVDKTHQFAVAFKPNHQYLLGFGAREYRALAAYIKSKGVLAVLDCKINDIGDTVDIGLAHWADFGYDAVTFNPSLGNLGAAVTTAHGLNVALLVLTLTSNKESPRWQRRVGQDGREQYELTAEEVKQFDADGCVIGATGHVTEKDVGRVVELAGIKEDGRVLLVPGVGEQGGDAGKFKGCNPLVNVSRGVIYNPDPKAEAKKYSEMFADLTRA